MSRPVLTDSDLTGPSRLGWQLLGLLVLLAVIVVYGIAPFLVPPPRHTAVQITMIPEGSYCTGPHGERLASVRHSSGAEVTLIPAGAMCYNPDGTQQ